MATYSSILPWRIPWTVCGHQELDMTERHSLSLRLSNETLHFRKQVYSYQGGKRGQNELGEWDWHIYIIMYEKDN